MEKAEVDETGTAYCTGGGAGVEGAGTAYCTGGGTGGTQRQFPMMVYSFFVLFHPLFPYQFLIQRNAKGLHFLQKLVLLPKNAVAPIVYQSVFILAKMVCLVM